MTHSSTMKVVPLHNTTWWLPVWLYFWTMLFCILIALCSGSSLLLPLFNLTHLASHFILLPTSFSSSFWVVCLWMLFCHSCSFCTLAGTFDWRNFNQVCLEVITYYLIELQFLTLHQTIFTCRFWSSFDLFLFWFYFDENLFGYYCWYDLTAPNLEVNWAKFDPSYFSWFSLDHHIWTKLLLLSLGLSQSNNLQLTNDNFYPYWTVFSILICASSIPLTIYFQDLSSQAMS